MRGSTTLGRRAVLALAAPAAMFLLTSSVAAVAEQAAATLTGTWTIVASDVIMPDGTRVPSYGPNPNGTLIFDAAGHYSLQIIRSNIAKFKSNNRTQGTPDENAAAVHGMISHFGSYTAQGNELTLRIEGSSFPNWAGTVQKRPFRIATDNLIWQVAAASGGGASEVIWRKAK